MQILRKYQQQSEFLLMEKKKKEKKLQILYQLHLHNEFKVMPLHVMLPKTSAFVKYYDGQTKWKYFLIEDDDLLKKYNTIWDKGSADINREFESEPAYNEKFYNHEVRFLQ